MKIKNIRVKVLAFVILLFSTSCDKWLELKPQDGLVREDFWKTKEQLRSAVIGCYSSLLNQNLVANLFLWGELRADMIAPTSFAFTDYANFATAEILPTNRLASWSNLYTTINYCNTVIEYAPQVLDNDDTLEELDMNAYVAEARGLRALMYFYILRIWGEAPLQLKASSSDSKIEQLPKSSKEAIFNQIVADLDFASKNAASTYGSEASDKGRLTVYGINALQADVYLWNDMYKECEDACNKVINSNRYGLLSAGSQGQWFNSVFSSGNSVESIFEFQFSAQALNPWYYLFTQSTRQFTTTEDVAMNLYGIFATDPDNIKDYRGAGASFRSSDYTIWKHSGTSGSDILAETSSFRHWFVYRYSDILLLKAEALAWQNRGAEALTLINDVRTRAHALDATLKSPDPNSAVEVTDYILLERAREFAFEGKRWFDLMRNAKRKEHPRIELITDMIAKVAPSEKQASMISKYKDQRSWYAPIHFSELQADKLLEQNSFYK